MPWLVINVPRPQAGCTFPSVRRRTAGCLLGSRGNGHGRYGDAFGHLAYFSASHFAPLFHAENRNVITIRVADACEFSIGREYNPVGPIPGVQSRGDPFRFQIININTVVEKRVTARLNTGDGPNWVVFSPD